MTTSLKIFDGTWIQESQDGRDGFLKAFGMNIVMRKLAATFKPKLHIKVIAENAYRERSTALDLDRIVLLDQEIENEIPRIACGMSTSTFDQNTGTLFMKFRATMDRSRETDEKCLVPAGNLVERTRTIENGKLVQIVTVKDVKPYKLVYRRKKDDEVIESSSDESEDESS